MIGFWVCFHIGVLFLLALDLYAFQKESEELNLKRALWFTGFWIFLALLFSGWLYQYRGNEAALQFLTGYLLEKSLSMDNLFVFLMIFSSFKIPLNYQKRILFWGILGALVLRAGLILLGTHLVREFHWLSYALGAFLCFTGIRFLREKEEKLLPEQYIVVRLCRKWLPYTDQIKGGAFFIRERGHWAITRLFVVLVLVESTDLIFALDSVPAILAITTDPFIVYTSNVFAILGLRSLYFVLASLLSRLKYFKVGLAAILVFIGLKMLVAPWVVIPVVAVLSVTLFLLGLTVFLSLRKVK